MRKPAWTGLALALVMALSGVATAQERPRPNIVLIIADDVAFTDFGAYGSEIRTPNIDALARRGTLFTNYHATPMCAPSRAMLMTGIDSHRAGIGNLPETTPEEHRGSPAYLGRLHRDVPTIAERLRVAGYRTFMAGKWHLGHTPGSLPSARGFDRTFILDATGADNWEHRPYLPYYDRAEWFSDGEAVDQLPADFYSSEYLVERMTGYIDEATQQEGTAPFFAYLAFQAIHIPVQAPREYTMRYADRYHAGWQALREERHRAAVQRGIVPADARLGPMHPEMRDWDTLSAGEREWYARAMAVNAGMLEAMDHYLGQLIAHLRETGEYENTIFIVTSDNGPEGALPTASGAMRMWMWLVGYSRDIETLGERGSFAFIGPEWASASASPHHLFKFYAGEGGTRVPLIVAGPGVESGQMARQLALISDIPATIAAFAGTDAEGMTGRSLMPVLEGGEEPVYGPDEGFGVETAGRMAYFEGRWKILRNGPPLGDNRWRLYDLDADPGETTDLSTSDPERFAAMQAAYRQWAEANGVLDMPEGYDPIATLLEHSRAKIRARYWWAYLLAIAFVIGIVAAPVWFFVRVRRRRRATAPA
jgi:arylsulfatase/uncharacterized sulfatase